jgi:malonyl-CoA O-methyltransferase
MKEKIRKNFDKACKTYDAHCNIQNIVCDKSIELLLKYNRDFFSIADFACGTGESTSKLINHIHYHTCYAIDFSEKLLSVAKDKLPEHIQFFLTDFDNQILFDDQLDLIFCNMGLQWSFDLLTTMKLLHQYLYKHGLLLFSIPNYPNFPEIKEQYKLKTHEHEEVIKMLNLAGFKLIKSKRTAITEKFNNPIEALKPLKNTGVNCGNIFKNFNRKGLSKKFINNIFTDNNLVTLTYNIGIYLAKKK